MHARVLTVHLTKGIGVAALQHYTKLDQMHMVVASK
jgi:hypothetical protein